MPKLSGTTLLKRAMPAAIEDRKAFVDAYGGTGPEADDARQQIQRMQALSDRSFESLSDAERRTAFCAFIWAEQNLESLADAHHRRGAIASKASRTALLIRRFRHANLGRSAFEAAVAESVAVDIRRVGRQR